MSITCILYDMWNAIAIFALCNMCDFFNACNKQGEQARIIRILTVTLVTNDWRVFVQILKGETSRVILGVIWNSTSNNDLTCDVHWCKPCAMCSTHNMSSVHSIAPRCAMHYAAHRVSWAGYNDLTCDSQSCHIWHILVLCICADL